MQGSWRSSTDRQELCLGFDQKRQTRLLILPPLFDEMNKLRHFTLTFMRVLDERGIDSFLPDLSGTNESLAPLDTQSLTSWRDQVTPIAEQTAASHILALRGSAGLVPKALNLQGWALAPLAGNKLLKTLLRARLLSAREAGKEEDSAALLEQGRKSGLTLGGFELGHAMIEELYQAEIANPADLQEIQPSALPDSPLWLRAEAADGSDAARALAEIIVSGVLK